LRLEAIFSSIEGDRSRRVLSCNVNVVNVLLILDSVTISTVSNVNYLLVSGRQVAHKRLLLSVRMFRCLSAVPFNGM
jgi:hypothetical protein